jgi:hypothetical protein
MGAPSPELCGLWLARAFNAHDVEAAAALYHPEASIVQVDEIMAARKSSEAQTRSARRWRHISG